MRYKDIKLRKGDVIAFRLDELTNWQLLNARLTFGVENLIVETGDASEDFFEIEIEVHVDPMQKPIPG